MDIKSLDKEKLQYALDNFAGIVKNLEYFESNFQQILKQPTDLVILATTGYYVSLCSLIKNKQGMDYTKIFDLLEYAIEENAEYTELNNGLRQNIATLREWEKSLEYEMKHTKCIRDKYFGHIDFVDRDFMLNHFKNKEKGKQDDLVKFFRNLIAVCVDYSSAVMTAYQKRHS